MYRLLAHPEAIAKSLVDGWFHTGDMARQTKTASPPSPAASKI